MEIQSKEAIVNGVCIHYKQAGSGPPLILLHGSPLTSRSWSGVIPRLAERFTVIAPDLRGHGLSEKPQTGYEVHTIAEDIRQLVLQLRFPSINLVGHDLGGIVAYVYAAQHMDQVRRLGILESPILGVSSPTMDKVLASYWHIGLYAHPRLPELLFTGREREYITDFVRTYRFNPEAFSDVDFAEYGYHLASPGGINGVMGVYRAIAAEGPSLLQLTKSRLTMPVWAVGGEHSMASGPLEQFQQLADDVHGSIVAGSGHWVIEEQPATVIRELEAFLS